MGASSAFSEAWCRPCRQPTSLLFPEEATNGAFGAGLMCGWSTRGDRPEFRLVTGVSTGALSAPFVFLGSDYDHKLKQVYTQTTASDIFLPRGKVFAALAADAHDRHCSTPQA